MSCNPVCRVCDKMVYSQSITFTGGKVVINLPEKAYNDGCKYCITLVQPIPNTATINAPVVFTIGSGTAQFPLTKRNCAPVTACGIRTRHKYSTILRTSATGAVLRMLGQPCCAPQNNLASISGTTPAATTPSTPTT